MIYRPTVAKINLQHLDHNLETVFSLAGKNRFVCPMIKANAYGHGAVQVAQHILKNYQVPLGVALIEEALELRQAGIKSEILVFGGFNLAGAKKIVDAQLTPVVSQFEHLEFLAATNEDISIHVKFNTGMNRLGFDINQADLLVEFLKKNPRLKMKAILSHLHSAHLADQADSKAQEQAQKLLVVAEHLKNFGIFVHLLNSDGIACLNKIKNKTEKNYLNQIDWGFRPGIMLYGYVTSSINSGLNLKPVMSLKSKVQQIRRIKKGDSVSYNATWTAAQDSVIGVVPIGYADGVHRILSNRGHVFIDQKEIPIRGKVCMDFVMIDLTNLKKDDSQLLQSEVVFFGDDQGVDAVALAAETISYEMLTSVSARVPREYV